MKNPVKLRTGFVAERVEVDHIGSAFFESGQKYMPDQMHALVALCRGQVTTGSIKESIINYWEVQQVLGPGGELSELAKNVILSSVDGEDMGMAFYWPVYEAVTETEQPATT